MDYKHIFCECGGTIGMYDRNNFACDRCKKEYPLYQLEYDTIMTNEKTGWQFPMKLKEKESEVNPMTHNITIKKTEKRVIEEYWLMRGIRINAATNAKEVIKECESEKEPTLEQIAQFLSDSNADFVSVEHNYRFEPELPFC